MDLSNLHKIDSTGSDSSDIVDNSSMITPSKRDIFLSTCRHQNFTFPNSLMHYIAKNPKNSEVYQKIVQCSKYFFIKNEILVIDDLYYKPNEWKTWEKIHLKNIDKNTILCKLWITDTIRVYPDNKIKETFVSSIIPKIYRCDAKYLSLYEQIISLNEFTFLCISAKILLLNQVTVKYNDGTIVLFENIIEQLPQLKGIDYTFSIPSNNISKNTFKELWKIPHLSNYDVFYLNKIPEDFDIDSFYSFMKKNKNTRIYLEFSGQISEAYKAHLKIIVDEIIETKDHNYKPSCIKFPGINPEQFRKLYDIWIR